LGRHRFSRTSGNSRVASEPLHMAAAEYDVFSATPGPMASARSSSPTRSPRPGCACGSTRPRSTTSPVSRARSPKGWQGRRCCFQRFSSQTRAARQRRAGTCRDSDRRAVQRSRTEHCANHAAQHTRAWSRRAGFPAPGVGAGGGAYSGVAGYGSLREGGQAQPRGFRVACDYGIQAGHVSIAGRDCGRE
jgi:hypothetical protein